MYKMHYLDSSDSDSDSDQDLEIHPRAFVRLSASKRPRSKSPFDLKVELQRHKYVECQAQLRRKMLEAVLSNSPTLVKKCMELEAPLNEMYGPGRLLHHAIVQNYVDIVRLLLNSGADPHLLDKEKQSALQLAVIKGSSRIVQLLLKAGANVHYIPHCQLRSSYKKQTILHEAAMRGNKAIIGMLLDHGANIHAVDNRGVDVMGYAAAGYSRSSWNNRADRDSLVKFLISRGAKILHDGPRGENKTFHAFLQNGTSEGLQILLDNVKHEDLQNQPVVQSALQNRLQCLELIKLFLDTGVLDLDVKDSSGDTVLHKAVLERVPVHVINFLLYYEANPYSLNASGHIPLHTAVVNADYSMTRVLLEYDDFLNARTRWNIFSDAVRISDGFRRRPQALIARLLVRHMALFESIGCKVSADELNLVQQYPEEFTYFERCRNELAIMKDYYIHETSSFYNVLTARISHNIPQSDHVIHGLSHSMTKKFPIYGEEVFRRFIRLQSKIQRKEEALRGLVQIIPFNLNAFPLLADRILDYLNMKDLEYLSEV